MCIEASPSGISNRARARFYWLASVPGNVWWGGVHLPLPPHACTCPTPFHVHSNHLGWKDSWVRIICHTHVSFATVSFRATKLVQRCQHSGLYQSFHRRSIASPSCVWCQHLFALSQAARTGKFKSSGEKAGDCSCSCIPTKAGQAYPCGGLHKVLFAVTHTYFTICVTCFVPYLVFFCSVALFVQTMPYRIYSTVSFEMFTGQVPELPDQKPAQVIHHQPSNS